MLDPKTVMTLGKAAEKLEMPVREVRALIRKFPTLAPPRVFGRLACSPEWVDRFELRASALEGGLCVHCGKPWSDEEYVALDEPSE